MERGTVKFFDSRDNKRFGFIRLESGEEIFFHFNDGEHFTNDGEDPVFTGSGERTGKDRQRYVLRDPKKGDELVFERGLGSEDRDKACPWGYGNTYDKYVEWLENRPVFRLVKETTNRFGEYNHGKKPVVEQETLWEGQNILELSTEFPRPRDHRRDLHVNLTQIEDGLIQFYSWFEKLVDGEWVKCDDPRIFETELPRNRRRRAYA